MRQERVDVSSLGQSAGRTAGVAAAQLALGRLISGIRPLTIAESA